MSNWLPTFIERMLRPDQVHVFNYNRYLWCCVESLHVGYMVSIENEARFTSIQLKFHSMGCFCTLSLRFLSIESLFGGLDGQKFR